MGGVRHDVVKGEEVVDVRKLSFSGHRAGDERQVLV